jgi:hypothetical protein
MSCITPGAGAASAFMISICSAARPTAYQIIGSLHEYLRSQDPLLYQTRIQSGDAAYIDHLNRLCPAIHSAFFEPSLDLAMRKSPNPAQ